MRPDPGGWRLVIKFDFFTAFVVCGGMLCGAFDFLFNQAAVRCGQQQLRLPTHFLASATVVTGRREYIKPVVIFFLMTYREFFYVLSVLPAAHRGNLGTCLSSSINY
jgi:hypothetical protein